MPSALACLANGTNTAHGVLLSQHECFDAPVLDLPFPDRSAVYRVFAVCPVLSVLLVYATTSLRKLEIYRVLGRGLNHPVEVSCVFSKVRGWHEAATFDIPRLNTGSAPLPLPMCAAAETLLPKSQIKRNQCDFHYVEIMACPSGCLNGGGQVQAPPHLDAECLSHAQGLGYVA